MRVLVTGASGFVGRAVANALAFANNSVIAVGGPNSKMAPKSASEAIEHHSLDLSVGQNLSPLLDGVDAVVHLAARSDRHAGGPRVREVYRSINVDATLRLAQAAANAKVAKFVFISSAYVNGAESGASPFSEKDAPRPDGLYGRSKFDAEMGLHQISLETGLRTVIVRPGMIVGPSQKSSLNSLCKLIELGVPLPFSGLRNRRNLAGLDNIVKFIDLCLTSAAAAGETFLICDQPSLSTPDLVHRLALLLDRPDCSIYVPEKLLRVSAGLLALDARFGALWKSQEISTRKAQDNLGWRQSHSLDDSLWSAVDGYLRSKIGRVPGRGVTPGSSEAAR
jgi:nucleoside-diphosphate-sugar epimerase